MSKEQASVWTIAINAIKFWGSGTLRFESKILFHAFLETLKAVCYHQNNVDALKISAGLFWTKTCINKLIAQGNCLCRTLEKESQNHKNTLR